jgi:Concanavalin A-like lectin/glucanases superfamily
MAIAFNGTNPNYLSTTTAPPSSTLSFSCFVSANSIGAAGHKNNIIAITNTANSDGTQSHNLYLYEDSATTTHLTYSNPNGTIITNFPNGQMPLTDGSWFFVAFAVNGTNNTVYWKYAGGPGFYTATNTAADTAFTPAYVAIGSDAVGGQAMNGSICGVRIWNGVLTAADFEIESQCVQPFRTTDLWADWRMDSDLDLRDRVRGNLLTAANTGNISQASGPPVPEYRIIGVL